MKAKLAQRQASSIRVQRPFGRRLRIGDSLQERPPNVYFVGAAAHEFEQQGAPRHRVARELATRSDSTPHALNILGQETLGPTGVLHLRRGAGNDSVNAMLKAEQPSPAARAAPAVDEEPEEEPED